MDTFGIMDDCWNDEEETLYDFGVDSRWESRNGKQQRWESKKRKTNIPRHLPVFDVLACVQQEKSLRLGVDCSGSALKYKTMLQNVLTLDNRETLISLKDLNMLNAYQQFQHQPTAFEWSDVMEWSRDAHKELDGEATTQISQGIEDFIGFVYSWLSYVEVRNNLEKTQFLIAVRLHNFVVIGEHLGFENHKFKDVDPILKKRYKEGDIKLKDKKRYRQKDKVHTEVQLLYGKEGNEFVTSALENDHLLLIYSYYIPCQDNKLSPNDCATNMAEFFSTNKSWEKQPAVVVGYDEAYPGTDTEKSERVLREGNIRLVALSSDCYTVGCVCHG